MRQNIFAVFLKFLYSHLTSILSFILFSIVFALVFSLYNLEVEAIIYSTALCFFIGALILIISFIRFYKKHRLLIDINKNINLLVNNLPSTNELIESDYQEIVEHLAELNNEAVTNLKTQRLESIDYYTTWVHQIKTPIAVMRMILQSNDTKENNELLAELFRIEQYVEMVLCYFRLDSSSNDFIFGHFSLDKIIKQAIRKYASLFIRKKIKLVYKGTDKIVLTDEKWLGFIIEQLLSNAIKYTDNGYIEINLNNNILCISDTGIGIAQEDLPRIFEKGYSGYNGRANKKSTGLGLYLCKQASIKLSHKIYAESQIGKGTQIFIDLSQKHLEIE